MAVNDLMTVSELREAFAYDPGTGVVTRLTARGNRAAGSAVGRPNNHGHLAVELCGHQTYVHRIAWALHYGEWPVRHIDHANGVPSDNRIANLRLATVSENLRNSRDYAKASGLPRGVYRSGQKFIARITKIPGAGAAYLGTYETPEGAFLAYRTAAARYFGEFRRTA
jgi:hypothetical protein